MDAKRRWTYLTANVLKTIEAIGTNQGRPLTLKGERGQGNLHLMAIIYHAFTTDTVVTSKCLSEWGNRLGNKKIAPLPLRSGMEAISESLHRQHYKLLWNLLLSAPPWRLLLGQVGKLGCISHSDARRPFGAGSGGAIY